MAFNRFTRTTGLFGSLRSTATVFAYGVARSTTPKTITDGASMALSAANIVDDKIVSATPTQARNVTTATAAQIMAALPTCAVGDSVEVTVINLAPATHALTLLGGSNVTIVGSAVVSAASSATFIARVASATTVVLYRK